MRFLSNKLKKRLLAYMLAAVALGGCSPASGVAGTAVDRIQDQSSAAAEVSGDTETAEKTPLPGYLWLVDGNHPISAGYVPADLIEAGNDCLLSAEAAEAWMGMLREMNLEGVNGSRLILTAGYISYEQCEANVEERTRYYLEEGYDVSRAERFAAYDIGTPGADLHQTGLLLEAALSDGQELRRDRIGAWLEEHAFEYGFVLTWTDRGAALRYVTEVHARAMKQLEQQVEGYLAYLASCQSYVFEMDGVAYRVQLVQTLTGLAESIYSVCGDNNGHYVAVTVQEGF